LEDSAEKLGRAFGAPNREGSILLGLPIPDGEGAGSPEGPLAAFEPGDADRKVIAGDAGRASFDGPDTAGLPGRGILPMRVVVAGEPGRVMPVCRRVICERGADNSCFS
jgi:hypothetical protein